MQVIFFEGYIGVDRFKFRAIPCNSVRGEL